MNCNTQYEKNQPSIETATMECPMCYWIFKVQKPDSQPTAYSFVAPKSAFGKIVISLGHVCRNPKCKHSFTIYWCDPEERDSSK